MAFNHKLDRHLGEMLRSWPGVLMPVPTRRIAGLGAALLVATAAAWAAPAPKAPTAPKAPAANSAAKPAARTAAKAKAPARARAAAAASGADTVLARMPWKVITRQDFLRSWARVAPTYRPAGTDLKAKRAFLDQLVQKELLAHAAITDSFAMAPLESAQFNAERRDILRRAVFQRLVTDSAVVTGEDIDSLRARLAPGQAATLGADQMQAAAMQFAQHRRAAALDARIKADIAPAWDDSVAALLVRAYGKLDPKLADPSNPLAVHIPTRQPALAAADTGKVLARTSYGPFTAGDFTRRFLGFDPFKTPLPASIDDVRNLGSLILGQQWLDRVTEQPRIQNDPQALAAIAERRESIALDHYYARHVQSQVDTTEATLRARYARTPDAYALPAQWIITRMTFATQAAADSAQQALAKGTPWDSICARAFASGDERRGDCANELQLPDPYPDTLFAAVLQGLKPGESSVLPMPETKPGDERRLLLRLVRHQERKYQPFEAARGFVVRDVEQDQAEGILATVIARLKAETPVTVNERALARTDLAGWARMVEGAAGTTRPGVHTTTSDR